MQGYRVALALSVAAAIVAVLVLLSPAHSDEPCVKPEQVLQEDRAKLPGADINIKASMVGAQAFAFHNALAKVATPLEPADGVSVLELSGGQYYRLVLTVKGCTVQKWFILREWVDDTIHRIMTEGSPA